MIQHQEDKGAAFKLIIEPGYQIQDLQKFITHSCLSKKLANICGPETKEAKYIFEEFETMLNENLKFQELISVFVASSMVFCLGERVLSYRFRFYLLRKTFRYTTTIHPVHLHVAAKFMYNNLQSKDVPNHRLNILTICEHISSACDTGLAISLCLLWGMLHELTEKEFKMFRFHPLSHLHVLLKDVVPRMATDDKNALNVYLIVQIVNSLINTIIFNDDKKPLGEGGYKDMFFYEDEDLKNLIQWTEVDFKDIKMTMKKTNPNWNLWMVIIEIVKLSICAQLKYKLQSSEEVSMY